MTEVVFIDTSALYAAIDAADANHKHAARGWDRVLTGVADGSLDALTHGSVLVETSALVQRRLGMTATRALHDHLVPVLDVAWVDEGLHARAVTALLAAGRRNISLVDWTSFELMRLRGIDTAFAFDTDFADQGFAVWT